MKSVQKIIDEASPSHTRYSLEPMPWMLPDSASSSLDLVQAIDDALTLHLPEVTPGKGDLDYSVLLSSLVDLERDVPIMIEHLGSAKEYDDAAAYIREQGRRLGIEL